ncbi:MAG: hypothetical protein Alpg2KO_14540 [Alphaproteobacteria bacterium]
MSQIKQNPRPTPCPAGVLLSQSVGFPLQADAPSGLQTTIRADSNGPAPDGQMIAFANRGNAGRGGKSGLQAGKVPGNTRRGRPQGQCHRKQTTLTGR